MNQKLEKAINSVFLILGIALLLSGCFAVVEYHSVYCPQEICTEYIRGFCSPRWYLLSVSSILLVAFSMLSNKSLAKPLFWTTFSVGIPVCLFYSTIGTIDFNGGFTTSLDNGFYITLLGSLFSLTTSLIFLYGKRNQ